MIDKYLDKVGTAGSVFAALCCLGFPALLSVLSAIGLGFLVNDDILLPLLVVFLGINLIGLFLGMRHHGKPWALGVGVVSSLVTVIFLFVYYNQGLVQLGIMGLVLSSLLNILLQRRREITNKEMKHV